MPYAPLPSVPVTAKIDPAGGNNPGNWTTFLTADVLGVKVAVYEIFHMVVMSVPAGASARIFVGTRPWGFVQPLSGSEWDPAQPLLLRQGQEVFFYWSVGSGTAPQVTVWPRYDVYYGE